MLFLFLVVYRYFAIVMILLYINTGNDELGFANWFLNH